MLTSWKLKWCSTEINLDRFTLLQYLSHGGQFKHNYSVACLFLALIRIVLRKEYESVTTDGRVNVADPDGQVGALAPFDPQILRAQ